MEFGGDKDKGDENMSGMEDRMVSMLDEFGLMEQTEERVLMNIVRLINEPSIEYAQEAYNELLNLILERGFDIDNGKVKKME